MILTEPVVETGTTTNPDQAAHIVLKPKTGESAHAYITRARVMGTPIEALCGFQWVPSRDPKPLPVCQECLDIFQDDPNGHGDRGELPAPA